MSNTVDPAAEVVPSHTNAGSSWQDHTVALTVAALAGAVVVAGLVYVASAFFASDDEPPILVKNGSIELHLLSSDKSWVQESGTSKWKISGGTRGKEPFDVTVAFTGGVCSSQTATGPVVRITYSDLTYIDLEAKNKSTRVTPGPDKQLTRVSDQLLSYPATGYINGITVNGTPLCAFTAASQLTHVLIMDQ